MRTFLLFLLACSLLCTAVLAATPPADTTPIYDIPKLEGITIDGDLSDWGERGFRVGPLLTLEGNIRPADNFDSRFRLAWTDQGILFVGFVRDNYIEESSKIAELGGRDAIELFMGTKRNTPGFYQLQVAPGADPTYGKARWYAHDYRVDKDKLPAITATIAGKRTADGYVLEALLPFTNLQITPSAGLEVGMQVWMTDSDARGDWFRTLWYPEGYRGPYYTGNQARVRLSDHASPAIQTAVNGQYELFRRARVFVYGVGELTGKRAVLKDGRKTLGSAVMAVESPLRAKAVFTLPMPPAGKPYGAFTVLVDGKKVGMVTLPADIDTLKAKAYLFLSPVIRPCVFSGTNFPPCDFLNPQQVEDLIGPYTIKTTFYDAACNPVTVAEKPGRYGAVIEVIPENGRTYRHFRTVYRVPDGVNLDKVNEWVTVTLPKETGFDTGVVAERYEDLRWRFAGNTWATSAFNNDDAVFYAGLADDKAGGFPDDWHTNCGMSADRRYWVGLKRKLYGTDKLFPNPFVAPTPKDGAPAPVARAGTLQEAGMKPDTVAKLDALCTEWAANTDEAFIACVVRHGVVVYNKAYGTRDEKPMTIHTRSYIASLTKMISGSCMMMVVDRGILDLDDDIAKVLPFMRNAGVKTPLTLRRMYTHYNGGWDHWGDYDIDSEEMLAWYYPYLNIGATGAYNGQGYALGSRIVEQVSGEALGDFYDKHLFKPLGCADTYGHAAGYGVYTTALDLAKIGQMVLNKGAYGNMRFFSEATWQKMMPAKLTMILGPDTKTTGGIGCNEWGGPGLGKFCISHGSASSTTCIIDYDNDLIIAMTRNAPGNNYAKYHPMYIQTVTDCLVK